mmetsp:Transcript_2756/g.6435  ORF Transcript_2756/g.6435 Transcript_2756/m.6435 type:complete len:323 (+) Transcript_2756:71-1039(+)
MTADGSCTSSGQVVAAAVDARVAVADRLADALDRRGVPNELLEAMQQQESCSLSRCKKCHQVQPAVRRQLLYLVHGIIVEANIGDSCWFEAVRIQDVAGFSLWNDGARSPSPEEVLTRATALALVADALEGIDTFDTCRMTIRRQLPCMVASASQQSHDLGGKEVSVDDVMEEQCRLLARLDGAPNVLRWLRVFAARFDVTTNSAFAELLVNFEFYTSRLASQLILQALDPLRHPPRMYAVGAFALALLHAGVLQASALRPDGVHAQRWEQHLLTLHLLPPAGNERTSPPLMQGAVLAALEFVTALQAKDIREQVLTFVWCR